MDPRPTRLYRYMPAAIAWKCLEESTLAFPPPSSFNDPFDTNIAVDLVLTEEDLRTWYSKNAAGMPGGNPVSEDRFVEKHLRDPSSFREIHSQARDSWMQNTVGVACFTKLPNDPLMWAHYADKHRGVVIGFDTTHPDFSRVRHVDYSKARPVHRRLGGKLEDMEMVKSDVWIKEEEWRISAFLADCDIRMEGNNPIYVQTLSRDAFASVTFGCRTAPEFRTAVALSLSRWNLARCELQEMKLCDLTYELKPIPFT